MIATQMFRTSEDAQRFPAGQTVFSAGEEGNCMYVVSEGEVDVMINDSVVETVGPGGLIGEMALIEHKPRTATVVARSDAALVPINEKRFNFLVQNTPHFALQMMKVMADRLRRADTHLK